MSCSPCRLWGRPYANLARFFVPLLLGLVGVVSYLKGILTKKVCELITLNYVQFCSKLRSANLIKCLKIVLSANLRNLFVKIPLQLKGP
jgi:hypothetical protein